jgi:hypothetical protein
VRPRDNPFRMQRTQALPFEPQGVTWEELWQRLVASDFRGAIVGPHGSGKTTLLEQIAPRLEAIGRRPVLLFRNEDGGGAPPAAWGRPLASLRKGDVLLVDGFGHLRVLWRHGLRALSSGRGVGLVVTSHRRRLGLPTLLRTQTSPALLMRLTVRLGAAVSEAEASDLYRRHGGNLREAFRALYDRVAAPEPAAESRARDGVPESRRALA